MTSATGEVAGLDLASKAVIMAEKPPAVQLVVTSLSVLNLHSCGYQEHHHRT